MAKTVPRPETLDDLQKAIVDAFPKLSKRLQQIAGYALDNPSELALETIATVAQRAGVQPWSLIRFGKVLGFSGYSEMQRVFRRRLTASMPDYTERLRSLGGQYPKDTGSLLDEFIQADIVGLRSMLQQRKLGELLEQAFTLLEEADTVYLVGHRRSFPVVCYLSYALSQLNAPRPIRRMSCRPCAKQRGVRAVAVTDGPLSPLVEHSTVSLEVQQPSVHLFRSVAVQMTLSITLIVGLGRLLEAKRGPALAPAKKKSARKR
jgi:DNA-binding MurR/RpiR family transcriptional regulator